MRRLLLIAFLAGFVSTANTPSEVSLQKMNCNYITDYYPNIYKAQINYLENEKDSALYYFNIAKKNCGLLDTPDILEKVLYAEICVKNQSYFDAFESLRSIILCGFPFEYLENNTSLSELKKEADWQKLKQLSMKINNTENNYLNWDLREEIVSMLKLDQEVRRSPIDYKEMRKVDSLHQIRIKEIFEQYGYPNQRLIGFSKKNENVDISFMLMHFNDLEYFVPKLLEFIKGGECNPYTLAYMIDSNNREKKMYTYGIYSNSDSTEIIDYQNLDLRRISIGLRSIQDHDKTMELIMKKYKN